MGFLTFNRADAIERGVATFYTATPCIRGHVGLRYAKNKACRTCEQDRALGAYRANPAASRQANKVWREANSDRVADYATRRLASGAMARSHDAWIAKNPDKVREYCQRRRARLAAGANDLTADEVVEITRLQGDRCAACERRLPLTIDHINPLSRGGENTRRNVQMLCRSCNSRKRASDPIEFARKLGRLL